LPHAHLNAPSGSDCQPFTAFGTTGIDDCAPAFGFHANQKAMGTRTAGFRGLVGTFHVENLWYKAKPCIISVFQPFLKKYLLSVTTCEVFCG